MTSVRLEPRAALAKHGPNDALCWFNMSSPPFTNLTTDFDRSLKVGLGS